MSAAVQLISRNVGSIRLYSTKSKKDLEAAFTERLKQLEQDNLIKPNDALLGSQFRSLIDKDPRLSQSQNTLNEKKYQYDNQRVLSALKIPQHANKQARDIALSQPWTGQESTQATAQRMLQDVYKPLKIKSQVKKLSDAKTTILEHKLTKQEPTKLADEDSKFKEIYAERFTPIGSFDKIKTIADARIEQAMREGQFKSIPRGRKLDVEVGTYVDRTEHHLNNLLVKQNVTPPWIERQGQTNSSIQSFKVEFINKFESHLKHFYHEDHEVLVKDFHGKWRRMFEDRLKIVNDSIRNYNLQAPMSTQKFYMTYEREFQKMRDAVNILKVRDDHVNILEEKKLEMEKENQEDAKIGNRLKRLKFWERW